MLWTHAHTAQSQRRPKSLACIRLAFASIKLTSSQSLSLSLCLFRPSSGQPFASHLAARQPFGLAKQANYPPEATLWGAWPAAENVFHWRAQKREIVSDASALDGGRLGAAGL